MKIVTVCNMLAQALADYSTDAKTDRAKRVLDEWVPYKSVMVALSTYFAADISLRTCALSVLGFALGEYVSIALVAGLVIAIAAWEVSNVMSSDFSSCCVSFSNPFSLFSRVVQTLMLLMAPPLHTDSAHRLVLHAAVPTRATLPHAAPRRAAPTPGASPAAASVWRPRRAEAGSRC